MINVKEATDKAIEYLLMFFPGAEHVQLDEMELSSDKKKWSITLSYAVSPTTPSEILSIKKTVKYKVFQVELKSGEVVSMKNKDLNKLSK